MPEITIDPISLDEDKKPQKEILLNPVQPVATGETVLPAIEPVQSLPRAIPFSESNNFQQNLDQIQKDPSYFDDLERVHKVGLVDAVVSEGRDLIKPNAEVEKNLYQTLIGGVQKASDFFAESQREAGEIDPVTGEVYGALETIGRFGTSFIGGGVEGAAALAHATLNTGLQFITDSNDKTNFVDDFVSFRAKFHAAYGNLWDYDPVMDQTERNLDLAGRALQATVGKAGDVMGDVTLKATGSPMLAAAVKTTPDALLMALPLIPKGVRFVKQTRAVRAYERSVLESLKTKAEKHGLRMEVVDEAASALEKDTGINGQSIRLFDKNNVPVGQMRAVDRAGTLQIVASELEEPFRGKGLGTEMYESLLDRASVRGYTEVTSDTAVSTDAANVYASLRRKGYDVEQLDSLDVDFETVTDPVTGVEKTNIVSKNGRPIFRVKLDKPAATSTLSHGVMKLETLKGLRGFENVDNPIFKKWFEGSKIVDALGKPLRLFHGTNVSTIFDVFDTRNVQLGSHFGTFQSANTILGMSEHTIPKITNFGMKYGQIPPSRILPVYLNIKNPLRLRDYGGWDLNTITRDLVKQGILDLKDRQRILYDDIRNETEHYEDGLTTDHVLASVEEFKKVLGEKGYDGVIYTNAYEHAGNDSYIAFNPNQIRFAILTGPDRLSPLELSMISDDILAGKNAGEIVVETVHGHPVQIISGVENALALDYAAQSTNVAIGPIRVKFQEKVNLSETDIAQLEQSGRSGVKRFVENDKRLALLAKDQAKSILQKLRNLFVDTSGNVKAELLKHGGEAGEWAVMQFALKAGATPKAHLMFQDYVKAVFGRRGPDDPGLSRLKDIDVHGHSLSEVDAFNLLTHARRTIAIVKSGGAKVKGGKFTLEGVIRPEDAPGTIYSLRQALGEKRFAQLNARVDHTFDVMHNQLVRLRDNGIIDMNTFKKMEGINYIKREFIEAIDPVMMLSNLKGKKISIGESGIYHLGSGSKKAQVTDVQSLVAEYLVRTENRIFRNNANQALLQVAEREPENGFVRVGSGKKLQPGWAEIKVLVDGKPEAIHIKEPFASEWIVNQPGMNAAMANIFRIVNGTFIVKPLATGINPGFALVNFPRDIHHAWKASGDIYSKIGPVYVGQIMRDIITVSKDAWNKTGRYRDFVDEGGGMQFLTHQGFDILHGFDRQKDLLRQVGYHKGEFGRKYTEIKEALSKVNEYSELAVRLAVRERVLRNQQASGYYSPQEATFIARDMLDFSQGGSVTQAMESIIPYTNAAAQAIRTSLREYGRGKRAASVAAIKDLQLLGLKAAITSWGWAENPQTMAQVDPHTAYTNVIFPTGLMYKDQQGNDRWITINFAMDTTILPFTSPFDYAVTKSALLDTGINPDMVPDSHWLETAVSALPIIGQVKVGSPMTQAVMAMAFNKDTWANKDIWTGDANVIPGARTDERTEGTIYEDLGKMFPNTVSPVQLQKTVKTFVPSNTYFNAAEWIGEQIRRASDPVQAAEQMARDQSDITKELIANFPGLRRMIHVTHPAAQTSPELQAISERVQTWRAIEGEQVRRAVREMTVLKDSTRFNELMNRVAQIAPDDVDRVKDLFTTGVAVDEMYKNNKYDVGFVGKGWFNLLAGQNPETKADLVYWKWVTLSDENARNLLAVVESIDKVGGRRIRTDAFNRHFARLVAEYGNREQRTRAVIGQSD